MGFDPASLLLIGTLVSGVGTAVTGIQQFQMANANAKRLEQDAILESKRSAAAQSENISENRRRLASTVAQISALGAPIGAGTGLEFIDQSARAAKVEQLNIATQGALNRRARLTEAQDQRSQGRQALTAGLLGGAGKAISGGARFLAS